MIFHWINGCKIMQKVAFAVINFQKINTSDRTYELLSELLTQKKQKPLLLTGKALKKKFSLGIISRTRHSLLRCVVKEFRVSVFCVTHSIREAVC